MSDCCSAASYGATRNRLDPNTSAFAGDQRAVPIHSPRFRSGHTVPHCNNRRRRSNRSKSPHGSPSRDRIFIPASRFELTLRSACLERFAARGASGSAGARPDGPCRRGRAGRRDAVRSAPRKVLESECSDSSPRVRDARSVIHESATPVHAAIAGVRNGHYSRRLRQGPSGRSFPGVRSRRRDGRYGRDGDGRSTSLVP
jgi:hypothetical protein